MSSTDGLTDGLSLGLPLGGKETVSSFDGAVDRFSVGEADGESDVKLGPSDGLSLVSSLEVTDTVGPTDGAVDSISPAKSVGALETVWSSVGTATGLAFGVSLTPFVATADGEIDSV